MCMVKHRTLRPSEALKRINSAATIVAIGPSSSGKSTLIYAVVNHKIVVFIKKGIGDKSQTTIIPCNFLFEERLQAEHFGLRVKVRSFSSKDIHIELMEQLAILFSNCDCNTEDTIECIDSEWFERILEPETAAYHLRAIKDDISLERLREALGIVLKSIENADESFADLVYKKKAELKQQKIKITEIKRMIFMEMWEKLSKEQTGLYQHWIDQIGTTVENKLYALLGDKVAEEHEGEYSVERGDEYKYGGDILRELFDPYQPYSLIVEEMTLACRPREELLARKSELPLRFCLRDTMGLNQIDSDSNTIKEALDIALNCSPDSIMLLLNLEERDDTILESCDAIAEKMKRADKMQIPIHVLFTKADKLIDSLIYNVPRETVVIRQTDYNDNILGAIEKVEKSVDRYLARLPKESVTWLSLRYKEVDIDPIQKALSVNAPDEVIRFTPQGLYDEIEKIIADAQSRILPKGINALLPVEVIAYDKPVVKFSVDANAMKDMLQSITSKLTEDAAVVNRYLITSKYTIHGRSVVNYYRNLQNGQGYKTNAKVYGNFNINMKLMIFNVLCEFIPEFLSLYGVQAVKTDTNNLEAEQILKIVEWFDKSESITQHAYADINPLIWDSVPENVKVGQKLHLVFRHYFTRSEKYYMVMNKVALQLSYSNSKIRKVIDVIYRKPITYDATIREMQDTFKSIFENAEFATIVAEELGDAMTDLVNKMFLAI